VGTYGHPQFYSLTYRRAQPVFFAFDLLWLDGEDLRGLPLLERKRLAYLPVLTNWMQSP
jgi:ATP-dependent DNA ligase